MSNHGLKTGSRLKGIFRFLGFSVLYPVHVLLIIVCVRVDIILFFSALNSGGFSGSIFKILKFIAGWSFLLFFVFLLARLQRKVEMAVGRTNRRAIVLFGVMSVLTLLLLEYRWDMGRHVDRGNGVHFQPPNMVEHRSWRGVDIEYRHDGEGFRSCPYSETRGSKGIILVGDSFIYGEKVSTGDTLCARLGDSAQEMRNERWHIKNLGFCGIGFPSAVRIAEIYVANHSVDWIIFGYDGEGNAFRFCDPYCQMRLLKESVFVRGLAVLLGADVVSNTIQSISNRFPSGGGTNRLSDKTIGSLAALSKKSSILVVSYFGDDPFLARIKSLSGEKIHVLYYDLPHGPSLVNPLVVPYDGHPSGKANMEIANKIVAYIFEHDSKSVGRPGVNLFPSVLTHSRAYAHLYTGL